jgi:uncharacterized SAM-binding protein YcdF (DUF218 family)
MVPSWQIDPIDNLRVLDSQFVCIEAIKLWRAGAFEWLLVSGGIFLPSTIQTRPASDLMGAWFEACGISSARIIKESRSLDTYGNVRYSLDELDAKGIKDPEITVCTHRIHGMRIRHTFKAAHGIDVHVHAVHLPLTIAETAVQWLCAFYHLVDTHGTGWFARAVRSRRLHRIALHLT